ncbi:MAG: hypothetical protein AAF591_19875 [Verrucomicrobiota bacterium]
MTAIKSPLSILVFLFLLLVVPAQGIVIVTVTESGGDVIFSAMGTLNIDALSLDTSGDSIAGVVPSFAMGMDSEFSLGADPASSLDVDFYVGLTALGGALGPGTAAVFPTSGTGDRFGISLGNEVRVPDGFVSGGTINATSVFGATDFATIGLTQGTYVWSWGNAGTADQITVNIVPEPSVVVFVGAFCFGLGVVRARRRNGSAS